MDQLHAKLSLAKGEYKAALKNLEMISDEIHERRRSSAMGPRGCGVGAEGSGTAVEGPPVGKPELDAVSGERSLDAVTHLLCSVPGDGEQGQGKGTRHPGLFPFPPVSKGQGCVGTFETLKEPCVEDALLHSASGIWPWPSPY